MAGKTDVDLLDRVSLSGALAQVLEGLIMPIVAGVDCHKDSHAIVVIDELGKGFAVLLECRKQ